MRYIAFVFVILCIGVFLWPMLVRLGRSMSEQMSIIWEDEDDVDRGGTETFRGGAPPENAGPDTPEPDDSPEARVSSPDVDYRPDEPRLTGDPDK